MNWTYFKSRTFWTVVAMFIVNGGNAVVPMLDPQVQTVANIILSALTVYFHTNPSQTYNQG